MDSEKVSSEVRANVSVGALLTPHSKMVEGVFRLVKHSLEKPCEAIESL